MADARIAHPLLKKFSSDPLTGKEEAAIAISQELLQRLTQLRVRFETQAFRAKRLTMSITEAA